MDIPIRFKFFDKLKLYQDYLKSDSMLERTKSEYWLCEKSLMLWAYSEDHKHLGVSLGVETFVKRAEKILEGAKKIGGSNYQAIEWVENNATGSTAMLRVLENLIVLELATELQPEQKDVDSKEITVSLKGFLLGELLSETHERPGFWSKNFRKYKLMLLAFYATFVVLFLTVFLVFLEQLSRFIKPETLGGYVAVFLGYSWWSTVTTSLLIYLGSRWVWKKL